MRKIVIIGAGNVGIATAKAVLESPDMELCGFVRRKAEPVSGFENVPVEENVFTLPEKPEGAIITVPSRLVEPIEAELLENGIYTVDAFDIHEELVSMHRNLQISAEKGNASVPLPDRSSRGIRLSDSSLGTHGEGFCPWGWTSSTK